MSYNETDSSISICHGPVMEETSRDDMGVKWCFKCRGRHEFEWVILSPVIDWNDESSVYAAMWGQIAHSECNGCHKHAGELFPCRDYQFTVF